MKHLLRSITAKRFSTQTFESRISLKEFYKNVHPDILSNAPNPVKEENMRSLKLLNDYMDKLKKNLGSDAMSLKFYTPEDNLKKKRKFLHFELHLKRFESMMDEAVVRSLRERYP